MRMKIIPIIYIVVFILCMWQNTCVASVNQPQDSRELQFQDMLMLLLLPSMNDKLDETYSSLLTDSPQLYPYFIEVKHVNRINGFRGFKFSITLEATPTVGPHIPVGKDLFTFEISPSNLQLIKYTHLKDPNKLDFPPNYQDMLRN